MGGLLGGGLVSLLFSVALCVPPLKVRPSPTPEAKNFSSTAGFRTERLSAK